MLSRISSDPLMSMSNKHSNKTFSKSPSVSLIHCIGNILSITVLRREPLIQHRKNRPLILCNQIWIPVMKFLERISQPINFYYFLN